MSTEVSISKMAESLTEEELTKAVKKESAKRAAQQEAGVERHQGAAIMLPKAMSLKRAVEVLNMRIAADDTEYDVAELIEGFPLDAAACFYRVLQRRYGFTLSRAHEVETFFGGKKKVKPQMKQIKTGPKSGDLIQVPIGAFILPDFDAQIISRWGKTQKGEWAFAITGTLKAKDRTAIQEIIAETHEEIRTNSIYRGKALVLRANDDGQAEFDVEPEFMETDSINTDHLILSKHTAEHLETSLFTMIKHTEECIRRNISLKQTILISGPFGTGKTTAARVAAKLCVQHGWTYIAVDKIGTLPAAIEFGKKFQPALVFAEDIDRIAENRDEITNEIMDKLDGILAKDSKIMTVLTTNNPGKIYRGLVRVQRVDAVVPMEAPDAEASIRLVRLYAGPLLDEDIHLDVLSDAIEGYVASTIAGIVKSAQLSMISRGDSKLTERDLLVAAANAKPHIDMVTDKKPDPVSEAEAFGIGFKKFVNGHDIPAELIYIKKQLKDVQERLY